MKLAVVIPARNEAATLPLALGRLRELGVSMDHVVVVDNGSTDGTADVAAGAIVVASDPARGRGGALRAGIEVARRRLEPEVLWLLHADTKPPRTALADIEAALADSNVVGGAFQPRLDTRGVGFIGRRALRTITLLNLCRCRLSGIHFGDQGLFVRASALDAINGVPDVPVLEDVRLCEKLWQIGRLKLLPSRAITSSRRFIDRGIVVQGLHDLAILAALRLRLPVGRLVREYNAANRDNAAGGA